MTEQPERSFFSTLAQRAGTQNRENQLSSTFAACFTQSPWFVASSFGSCASPVELNKPLAVSGWLCSEQHHLPKGGRERVDLLLSPSPPATDVPPFHLEKRKLRPPLTRGAGARSVAWREAPEYLSHRNEVSTGACSDRRLAATRSPTLCDEQDVHRALSGQPAHSAYRQVHPLHESRNFWRSWVLAHAGRI